MLARKVLLSLNPWQLGCPFPCSVVVVSSSPPQQLLACWCPWRAGQCPASTFPSQP